VSLSAFVIGRGQRHLLDVVNAGGAASGFTSRLNGGKKQRDEHADNRDDY
jgi:hypothetical protein